MAEQELMDDAGMATKSYECKNMAAPMSLVVETTGFMGGDAGHGGQSSFKLNQSGGAEWEITVTRNGEAYVFSGSDVESVEIRVSGDAEMQNLQGALLQAAAFLAERQGA